MPPSVKTFQQDRYRIVHQFGQDENFALYEAYDNALKTNVVLKEVKNQQKKSAAAIQGKIELDFAAEVKLLTQIRHEHLLSIHDYFSEVDNHYLVMELTDGSNLVEVFEKKQKPFSSLEVARWTDQMLDALIWLHKHEPPIFHHRIAPQNIIITSNGKVKLLFSGSDRNLGAMPGGKLLNFLNTDFEAAAFNYLPLEQIWNGLDPASQKVILNSYDERAVKTLESPADARSDLYSLGASVYFALTGQPPTDALARSIDLLDGKNDPLVAPHKINPAVSPEISNVLLRAMEIRRENRYDSAAFMRQILRTAFTRTLPAQPKPIKLPENTVSVQPTKSTEQEKLKQERQTIERNLLKIEADQKSLAEERQLIQQKQLALEAAQKQQQELASEQLRQAEALRLKAEQRAAEAEQKLLEKEASEKTKNAAEFSQLEAVEDLKLTTEPLITDAPEKASQTIDKYETAKVSPVSAVDQNVQSNESTEDLFVVPEKSNSFKYLAFAALILIVFSGAGWAIWDNFNSKVAVSAETANSTALTTESAISTQPPAPQPTPASNIESASETNLETAPQIVSSEPTAVSENQFSPKSKNASAPAKRAVTPPIAKPTVAQKKTVTVDDIINDN